MINLDIPISWITPGGVEISQKYIKSEDYKFNISIFKKNKHIVLKKPVIPHILNSYKSQNAIVPNIIHSLDANHLIYIIDSFRSQNLFILTIHDCFIIHPNHSEILLIEVISNFIKVYANSSFINDFHKKLIEIIEKSDTKELIKIDGHDHVKYKNKLYVIPNIPYKKNGEFFEI